MLERFRVGYLLDADEGSDGTFRSPAGRRDACIVDGAMNRAYDQTLGRSLVIKTSSPRLVGPKTGSNNDYVQEQSHTSRSNRCQVRVIHRIQERRIDVTVTEEPACLVGRLVWGYALTFCAPCLLPP